MTMIHVAKWAADCEQDEQALELYEEVLHRFPRSTAAAIATCGQGFILARQGKHVESVACWERGVAFYSAIATPEFIDHANFYSGAWRALGEHYVKTRHWTNGQRAFLQWRPVGIGCVNGVDDYLSTRAYNIFICQTHAGPGTDTARQAWLALGCGGYVGPHDIPPFILVRLYAEADQLDDLQRLAENIRDATLVGSIPAPMGPSRAAAILDGIKLAQSRRWSDHVAAFDHLDLSQPRPLADEVCRHVAAWVLLREQNESASAVANGARSNKEAGGDLLAELLVNMTTPKAKEALGRLSRNTTSARRKLINELSRQRDARLKGSKINSTATKSSQARGTTVSRLPLLFYEPWPATDPGSLPKSLSADEVVENKR
jgi:hypothetical protein